MDESLNQSKIRDYLKVLLLHLAAKSESPAIDLQELLCEVIEELHDETKEALQKKSHLKLVCGAGEAGS